MKIKLLLCTLFILVLFSGCKERQPENSIKENDFNPLTHLITTGDSGFFRTFLFLGKIQEIALLRVSISS